MATNTKQKEYQRNYDKKTKMISVKYALHEMNDYNRLMNYLERTGQSANGFIKELIKDFFDKGHSYGGIHPAKEYERMEFLKFDYIDDEYFERLKNILGGDEEKYNVVLDYYSECIISELESTFEEKAMAFEEWVDTFEENVNSKEININVSGREFWKLIDRSMGEVIGQIFYG